MKGGSARSLLLALVAALMAPPAFADTLERLRGGSGELRLGYRVDAAPFSAEIDGAPRGYTIELCAAIAERVAAALAPQTINAVWRPVSVSTRFDALAGGDIDMLCGATTVTEARRQTMSFTDLTFQTDAAILVDANAYESGAWGAAIGVLSATTSSELIEELLTQSGDGFAELRVFANRDLGVERLRAGEIDSFFGDRAILEAISLREPGRFVLADTSFSTEPYAIALRLDDIGLMALANKTLRELYRSGAAENHYRDWFGGREPPASLQVIYSSNSEAEASD